MIEVIKKYWKFNFCQAFVFLSYYKINDNFLFRILSEDPQKYLSIDHISVINLNLKFLRTIYHTFASK